MPRASPGDGTALRKRRRAGTSEGEKKRGKQARSRWLRERRARARALLDHQEQRVMATDGCGGDAGVAATKARSLQGGEDVFLKNPLAPFPLFAKRSSDRL